MSELAIKVDTAEVRTKASAISTQKSTLEAIMNDMNSKVTSLSDCFESEAKENYVTKYKSVHTNIQNALNEVQKLVDSLNKAADEWDKANTTMNDSVNKLGDTNIFANS